jgi:hypothetical protein
MDERAADLPEDQTAWRAAAAANQAVAGFFACSMNARR